MAATEEEELKLCPAPAEATPDPSGVRSEEQLSEHLAAVEANPGDYIAHPEPDSLRFKLCDAAIVAQAPTGLASASIELPVSRLRNAWQRFYPLDLAVLLPDVLDTEEVFDEEGEMGQARTLAATAAVSGAVTSVVKRAPILGMVGRKATALPRRARMATRLLWVAIGCVMIAASASRAGQGSGAVFSSRCRVPLHELRLRGGQPPAPFGWEQGEGCDEEDCKELAAEVQS